MTTDKRSVYQKIEAGEYDNKAPYPWSPAQISQAIKRGQPVPETPVEDWQAARNEHNSETRRLESQFRFDALEEVGLKDHSKADRAYRLAWKQGHSAGLTEVLSLLHDLADLVL